MNLKLNRNGKKYPITIPEVEYSVDVNGRLINQQPDYVRIINSEVLLQNYNGLKFAKVIQRSIVADVTVAE